MLKKSKILSIFINLTSFSPGRKLPLNFLKKPIFYISLLFIIAFSVRIPLLHTEFERESDSIDFISVAENIASGNGFTRSIKGYYFDDKPVISSGSLVKPLLTPFVYSLLLYVKNDYYILQLFDLFLGAVDVLLFYALTKHFMDEKLSFVSALLIALNPNLIIENRFIESEPLFYFLLLLFFIIYFRFANTKLKYMLLGSIAGLSYLTRIEGILLIVCLILLKIKKPLFAVYAFICFALVILPNLIINYVVSGNPFHSYYLYHFSIFTNAEWVNDFYHPMPSPFDFIIKNYLIIGKTILQIQREFFIFISGFRFLGFLSILFVIYNYKKKFNRLRTLLPILLFLFFYYIVQTFTWATFCCQQRHFAFIYILLVLIIFALWNKQRSRRLLYILVTINIFVYLIFDYHQLQWIRKSIGFIEQRRSETVFSWIRSNTNKKDIIAARSPYDMYLWTGRPTILIPNKIPHKVNNTKEFEQFERKYNVKYIYVETQIDLNDYLTKTAFLKIKGKAGDRLYCVFKCS